MENDKICAIWCEFVCKVLLPEQITSKLEEINYSNGRCYKRNEDFRLMAKILKYQNSYYGEEDIFEIIKNGLSCRMIY